MQPQKECTEVIVTDHDSDRIPKSAECQKATVQALEAQGLERQQRKLVKLIKEVRHWFTDTYDRDTLLVSLASVAVERLTGDPLWVLIVGGPSTAKTETLMLLIRVDGVELVSTLTSEAALLSASKKEEHDVDATGGLLRKVEPRGTLLFKDFTSILSLHHNTRGPILAALREVYDGEWVRNKGTGGGGDLKWKGRIAVLAAVTSAWDKHHAAVTEMGDRFVLLRLDSTDPHQRRASAKQAMSNLSREGEYRRSLSLQVKELLGGVRPAAVPALEPDEENAILEAANLATYARTAVETDYRGDVVDAHSPEGAARLAKQLTQLFRGLFVIGVPRRHIMKLVLRCARDCIPPMRLQVLEYLASNPGSTTGKVRKGIQKPHATVDRHIQALVALGLVEQSETETSMLDAGTGGPRSQWTFSVADGWNVGALQPPAASAPGIAGPPHPPGALR